MVNRMKMCANFVNLFNIPGMKKPHKGFWTFYILWTIFNVALLVMAVYDTFGEFNKSTEEFWPFTVGGLKTYDFVELFVYLLIPLVIFYLTQVVHYYSTDEREKRESEKIRQK